MIVEIYDKNHFIIGCNDRDLLDLMKEQMDGKKIRSVNKIIIPLKSGPKVYRFSKYGLNFASGVKEVMERININVAKRKKNVHIIKSKYGGDIRFDYTCQGIHKPMDHQKIIYNIMIYTDAAAILADPGTCKTGPYLWAIDERIKRGQAKKALIITLSTLKENVYEEMRVQVPHLSGVILGNKIQADKILNKKYKVKKKNVDYDICIANYESMFSLVTLIDEGYFDIVICDEAHRIGSPRSRQTKEIIETFEFVKYKYIVTGTLHANNLMSFFMPFRFLGPDTLPYAKFDYFQREYMYTVDPDGRIWVPRPGSKNIVKQIVGDLSVVFTKEECLDLPPIIRSKLECELGPGQEKFYKELSRDLISEIEDMCSKCDKQNSCDRSCEESVVAKNALVLATKLKQITCGFYINTRFEVNDDGKKKNISNTIILDENPKLSLLIQTLNNMPPDKQIIIWTNHICSVEMIADRIGKSFGKDSYLTCYQKQNAFDQIAKFREKKIPYMIANPSKMGVGHNIQFSNYQIFFSNSHSFVQRDQAESRQHRKGQEHKVTAIDLVVKGTVDELILSALSKKQDLSISLSELARVLKKKIK